MNSRSLERNNNASGVQGIMGSRVGQGVWTLRLARLLKKMGGPARGVDTGQGFSIKPNEKP